MYEVKDIALAPSGEEKIKWAYRNMPLLRSIEEDFVRDRPFEGLKVALSVHMEAKTACLCRLLEKGGAEMHVTGCNPLSTQDDVAAAVAKGGMDVHAVYGAPPEVYKLHLSRVLECGPNIVIDDGGDLVHLIHTEFRDIIPGIIGGCEETTTGVIRLNAMAREGALRFPMITVNNARCKYLFDNRYGTGQSVWDGINRTTNLVVAGKNVVVAGYGWCGKGICMRAKGFGAKVTVCEIDPVKALEAMMDGFSVMPMEKAAGIGDLFITSTGCRDVISKNHFPLMKDGAVLCNAGHFNVEVDVDWLEKNSAEIKEGKANITGFTQADGRTLFVLAHGRLVNLASGDGHPVEIMDMSFAIQALSARFLADNRKGLEPGVMAVPEEIDLGVAERKLKCHGMGIDSLTAAQREYLSGWEI